MIGREGTTEDRHAGITSQRGEVNCLQSGRKLDFTRNNKKESKKLTKSNKVTYKCKRGIFLTISKEVKCYM